MPLATLKEVLGIATQSKTAIPGFNIDNIEIPEAIITAAEEYHCPVILTIGQGAIQAGQMHHLADVVRPAGRRVHGPGCHASGPWSQLRANNPMPAGRLYLCYV